MATTSTARRQAPAAQPFLLTFFFSFLDPSHGSIGGEGAAAGGGDDDRLPYDYDPAALKRFFKKRPRLVAKRIAQVTSTGGSVLFNFAIDVLTGKTKVDPNLEVQRAAELRDTITSLGPFFIKLGQVLSIRPDVLSPRSMVELQKLCDKVPSYESDIAFATIERELRRPVDEIFSFITPEPVAAASLGQVVSVPCPRSRAFLFV